MELEETTHHRTHFVFVNGKFGNWMMEGDAGRCSAR